MFAFWFILGTLVGAIVMFLWVRFAIRRVHIKEFRKAIHESFERAENGISDCH